MNHLSLSFIDAHVLLLLAFLLPACVIFWCFERLRKSVAVGFAIVAGLLVIGVSTWQDTLAALISTPRALAVLVLVATASISMFGIMVHSARKPPGARRFGRPKENTAPARSHKVYYHHVWTHVAGAIAGTTAALLIADGINFLRAAGTAAPGTANALSQTMTRVSSGKAAEAVRAGHGMSPAAVLGVAVAALIALVFAMRRHPSVRPAARGGSRAAPPPGAPPARTAVPGGSRAAVSPGAPPSRTGGH